MLGLPKPTTTRRAVRLLPRAACLAVIVTLVMIPAGRADEDHAHQPATQPVEGRVGVLVADHGEPPEYNQWTYESFREFFQHLIDMGLIPAWLTTLETGTILYDADCPACETASGSPRLIDAWLRPHEGPAVFVPPSDSLAAHYVLPGGPGFREPDIFEHVGLAAWHEWQRMGGRSPNYDEKAPRKQAVIDRLRADYGEDVAIRVGYMIDPRLGGGRQGIREALDALVRRDRIGSLVVAYHGVGFSDIMQTHHLRHQVAEHLAHLETAIPVRYTDPIGTTEHYVAAIVEKVQAELAKVPPDAAVAVHLSGHGLPTSTCGAYDCGADAYHRSSADLFARVRPAVEAAVQRSAPFGVFHLYGDGGEGEDDPDDEVDSPIEALEKRAAAGFTHVIDVPYEFDANSRDTLIVLRQGYGRVAPDWNPSWESAFTYDGMQVKLANANGGDAHKVAAFDAATRAALGPAPARAGVETAVLGQHAHQAAARPGPAAHDVHPAEVHPSDPTRVAVPHAAAHGLASGPRASGTDHFHGAPKAVAGTAHAHGGTSGAGAALSAALLALLAGAAIAPAAVATRSTLVARLVLAALGLQLLGLAADVVLHAADDEPVHLLENAGHWIALVGMAATAAVAGWSLRRSGVHE
jgi:hypothetical protein